MCRNIPHVMAWVSILYLLLLLDQELTMSIEGTQGHLGPE